MQSIPVILCDHQSPNQRICNQLTTFASQPCNNTDTLIIVIND